MDYEKAYKEALERAKRLRDSYYQTMNAKRVVEEIFPELAESEDEEIRKHIIDLVKDNAKAKSIPCDAEIAYLEKQKDASKAIEVVDRIDKYIDENVANAHDMKDSNPNKEYYLGWDDALSEMAGILQDVYSDEQQKEQKLAEWSEEDEKSLNRAINICINDFGENSETARFLKSLPERFNLQPKQEWSEEDEEMIKMILGDLEWGRRNTTVNKDIKLYDEKIAWLKAIRPQPHWKPSEEQMCYLKKVYESYDFCDGERDALESLYNDLKKLM